MEDNTQPRGITLDAFVGSEKVGAVRVAIARYRSAARQIGATFALAQAAGADLVEKKGDLSLKPNNEKARWLLAWAMNSSVKCNLKASIKNLLGKLLKSLEKNHVPEVAAALDALQGRMEEHNWAEDVSMVGAAPVYSCRDWFLKNLYTDALPFVWDSARKKVFDGWKARDPEITRVQRGWLVLQGKRAAPMYGNIGIEFPLATAKPIFNTRSIVLYWDRELGPLEFTLKNKLDGGRWHVWSAIRDGRWKAGTVTLNERKGKLSLSLSYHRPKKDAAVDGSRVVSVRFDEEWQLCISGPDGERTVDSIGTGDIRKKLGSLLKRREGWEARRGEAGAKSKKWGNRKAFKSVQDCISRNTQHRLNLIKSNNHAWGRRIADRAEKWRCGTVRIELPPKLGEHTWQWDQFRNLLTYKLEFFGAVLA